ncbi:MAG TPA: hypothetical protein VI455_02360 [Terriglobia bacterium]
MNRKRLLTLVLSGAMALMAGAPALAQDSMLMSIPFAFNVGTKSLPAGDYDVRQLAANTVVLQNASTRDAAFAITMTAPPEEISAPAVLVFNQYGDSYFLSEIKTQDSLQRIKISKLERHVAAETQESAENESEGRIVYVAAR